MCAMDSLIRTYVWAVLITGIFGMPVSRIQISEGPNYFVSLGSTINLTCLVGESTSTLGDLSWLHDGEGVHKKFNRGGIRVTNEYGPTTMSILQIQNVTANDAGNYRCLSNQGDSADVVVYVLDGSISEPIDASISTRDSNCVYEGIVYNLGEFIYPDKDNNPCLVCECKLENWDGVDYQRCFEKECSPDYDGRRALEAGCVPVYQEKKCCPVRYYCPKIVEDPSHGTNDTGNQNSTVNGNQCQFEGQAYDVGTEVSLNNSCIKCSCDDPPVMKCTRLSCPPNERNCPQIYKDGECCPTVNCPKEEDTNESNGEENIYDNCPTPMCAHKSCVIGVPPGHQCPTCICNRENCQTPTCVHKSCVIGIPPGQQCPTCICNEEESKEKDLEASHEKNDLEPLFEEVEPEPPYIEIYNGTETLDNEIPSSTVSKNFTEREFLSPEFEENNPQNEELEGEGKNRNITTRIYLLNEDESSLNATEFEPSSMQPNKIEEIMNFTTETPETRQKRSGNLETAGIQSQNTQQQWNIYQQDQFIEDSEDSGENSERELEGTDGEYSEVKVLSTKNAPPKTHDELVELDENELENVVWTTEVPGCPAPMCANSSCRIGIPPGHTCPTCVCRKRRRQP